MKLISFFKNFKNLLIVFLILVIVLLTGVIIFSRKQVSVFQGDYLVRIKPNITNNSLTDVYLYNDSAGSEVFFKTIPNVDRGNYHIADFSAGNLYVIERSGDADNMNNQSWTDELWKYNISGIGTKLYSAKGIDFRVSSENGEIAIFSQPNPKKVLDSTITITDLNGKVLKTFDGNGLSGMDSSKALNPLFWEDGLFWFTANHASQVIDVFTLDARNLNITNLSE
jgi:hypothetical protein